MPLTKAVVTGIALEGQTQAETDETGGSVQ